MSAQISRAGDDSPEIAPLERASNLRRMPSRAASTLERAERLCAQGRPAVARALLERSIRHRSRGGAEASPALLSAIARTHLLEGDGEAALSCLEAALASAEASGDQGGSGIALNGLASVHLQHGRLEQAEELYLRARSAGEAVADFDVAAKAAGNLGIIASIRGDLSAALAHLEDSLAALRRLGAPGTLAHALNNRALLLRRLGRLEEAERSYAEALHMLEALGDVSRCALVHVNLADLAIARDSLDVAASECAAAAALAEQLVDDAIRGEVLKLQGVVARERGELARAEERLRAAEELADRRQHLLLLAEALRERAELHRRQGRNRDMFQCLNRSHRLFEQLQARREVADVDGRMHQLEDEFLRLARRWGEAIEAKDRFTQGHCERVADLACAIAERLGFDARALFWFRIGALLHDVGKLVVPPEVLNKPGKLSDDEWALMRSHTTVGVEMLADTEFPWDVRPIVESHHERWDGRGYPHGLAGEAIPLVARILAVADVYDALTSVRSYKRAMTHDEAMTILGVDVGTQFDPDVFAAFEEIAPAWRDRVAAQARAAAPAPTPGPDATGGDADRLTGLPGRRMLLAETARVLDARRDSDRSVALLAFGIDYMASVNVELGRATGDALLRAVAEALSRRTRASDVVARARADEFLVLLPDVVPEEVRRMAERLRGAAGHALAPTCDVTVSAGACVVTAPAATTAEEMLEGALAALAVAKRQGRDRVVGAD